MAHIIKCNIIGIGTRINLLNKQTILLVSGLSLSVLKVTPTTILKSAQFMPLAAQFAKLAA